MDKKNNILLIQASIDKYSPYIAYYKKLLDNNNIKYDVVQWNRLGDTLNSSTEKNIYTYNQYADLKKISLLKYLDYYYYARYIKKILRENEYSTIIVFSIQISIFISSYLLKYYKNRYILDIRDYSPILKFNLLKKKFDRLMRYSAINVVSSFGFLKWLPSNQNVIISHNIDIKSIIEDFIFNPIKFKYPIKVLTIGQIRDFNSNKRIIDFLGNNNLYKIQFSGMGLGLDRLVKYSKENKIDNILFTGKYEKKDENSIVKESDMMNILLPQTINSDSLMTNRFYSSVINQKPMIVNSRCTQADIVNKYKLGIIIDDNDSIDKSIEDYINNFDYSLYYNGCVNFAKQVKADSTIWNDSILRIIRSNFN